MLELLHLVLLACLTIMGFAKKGVGAGIVMGLALLFSLIGAFLRDPVTGTTVGALVCKLIGLILMIYGVFKYFSKKPVVSETA
jgi:hypothetical protein